MQTHINQEIQLKTELSNPFSYSIFPILILIIIIFLLILILFIRKKKKDAEKKIVIITPNEKDKNAIKNFYIEKINELLVNIQKNIISNREAYQSLSKLIRMFIYEMTNIKVQNYTLGDIKNINIPILYELVKEYYSPEFSRESKGDIISSIEKTRKVMEVWK